MVQLVRCLKSVFLMATLFAGIGMGLQARASVSVFHLSANCEDCASAAGTSTFGVTGTLTLQNYVPNAEIDAGSFVSFAYGGSNLVDPYTVAGGLTRDPSAGDFDAESAYVISGNIDTTPGPYRFALVFDDGLFFQTQTDGAWSTCAPKTVGGILGYYGGGSCGTFTPTPTDFGGLAAYSAAPVPEPGVWAMLCAGLGVLAVMRRRRA